MDPDTATEWLTGEQAIAHIKGCLWHRSDRTVHLQSPLSMIARALFQNALAEELARAQGPLQFQQSLPPAVVDWPVVPIPSTFWRDGAWDESCGFKNRVTSESVLWFEAVKADVYKLWPQRDHKPMPAPFDVDWLSFRNAAEALRQRLGISEAMAYRRLSQQCRRGAIKTRLRLVKGTTRLMNQEDWDSFDFLFETTIGLEVGAGGTNSTPDAVIVRGEEVVALWPSLVISATGEPAAAVAIKRTSGRPTIRNLIIDEMRRRSRACEMCETLAGEARALHSWVKATRRGTRGAPTAVSSIKNMIGEDYWHLRKNRTPPES